MPRQCHSHRLRQHLQRPHQRHRSPQRPGIPRHGVTGQNPVLLVKLNIGADVMFIASEHGTLQCLTMYTRF